MRHDTKRRCGTSWRGAVCLTVAIVLLFACLTACSDEILDPTGGTLSIVEGTGTLSIGDEPVAETTGGHTLIIQPTDAPFANAAHRLQMEALNVGDADVLLLRMDDTVILVDAGESDDYPRISAKLDEYGITVIDYFIITHFDNDHIGSAAQVLKNYRVRTVYMPDYVRDSRLYRALTDVLTILGEQGTTITHRLTEEVHIELEYGSLWIHATALYGAGLVLGSDDSHALEENNYSLITMITFGDIQMLLTGDAEQARIAELREALPSDFPGFQVIKLPHHGAYDKELGELLRDNQGILRSCITCVGDMAGVKSSLVTAIRSVGAGAYYTCNGDIYFATDGQDMMVRQDG